MQSESVKTMIDPLIGLSGRLSRMPRVGTLWVLKALSEVFGAGT